MLDSPPATPGRWQGDPRRKLLRDELASKTAAELATMYWEAIRVLDDGSNPACEDEGDAKAAAARVAASACFATKPKRITDAASVSSAETTPSTA